jgi:hypothetical protein
VNVNGKRVPVTAFAELASVLADQAAIHHRALKGGYSGPTPSYLAGKSGETIYDPTIPEERAAALLDLIRTEIDDDAGFEDDGDYWTALAALGYLTNENDFEEFA